MKGPSGAALLPDDVPAEQLSTFIVDGFDTAVSGVVYRDGNVWDGVPLGGLGTGYLDFSATGELGETTIFNDFPKPRVLGCPFLGVAADGELRWLSLKPPSDGKGATHSAYWGHYPVADARFVLDLPLEVAVRAWSPFIPGDAAASNTPGAVFEIRVRNTGLEIIAGRIFLTFPGPEPQPGERFERESIGSEAARGIAVTSRRFGRRVGYGLAALGADAVEVGGPLGTERKLWSRARDGIDEAEPSEPGGTLVASISLAPSETRVVRLILAWYYPDYRLGFSYHHVYGRRFAGVGDVVAHLAREHAPLLRRTLAWQGAIYAAELPDWLKDALVNGLYSLAKNSWWNHSERPDDWWGEDGLFTHSESFTGCPITETMVCRFHGHFPLLFLFPELEKTTLRAFAHYQLRSGEIPFSFGHPAGLYDPRFTCQHPLNSAQFVQVVYRYYLRTKDDAFLRGAYPAVRDALRYLRTLDVDQDGLVNEHPHALPGEIWPANQFYDIWPWHGTSAYVAGIWLATLGCAGSIGQRLGEQEFAEECQAALERGLASFDQKLWNGRYYRVYSEPYRGDVSEVSLANQLMGEWCARVTGLGNLLPSSKVESALDAVLALNVSAGSAVIVNGVNPDGTPHRSRSDGNENDHAAGCFVGESLCAAMTMIYCGKVEAGLEVAQRIHEAIALRDRRPWDQHCIISPADGHAIWGSDYYSNMVVWALPMALAKQDIADFASPGGLLGHILQASHA